ncbi:MAG: 50S ribosomal protein L6 [Gammaproteobacteria bacterium]|nr:50S ribosomal protein L6 [Gammaproteobacteria bacterium]
MSRVAKQPVVIPSGVQVSLNGQEISAKGPKGNLALTVHGDVQVAQGEQELNVASKVQSKAGIALAGTTRALLANMVKGVHEGFERKLELVGVGYRAQSQGKTLNLTLGFSHPVNFPVPEGITVETPSQTEIVIKGADKQQVGQVAAKIRAFRPPEPYKGKGVRYSDERVVLKEAKKK